MFEKYLDDLPGSRLQILEYICRNPYVSAAKLKECFVSADAGNYYEHALIETLNFFLHSGFIRITPYQSQQEDNLYHDFESNTEKVANYPMNEVDKLKSGYHCCILPKGAAIIERQLLLMRQLESVERIASEAKNQSSNAELLAHSASATAGTLQMQFKHTQRESRGSKKAAIVSFFLSVLAILATVVVPFIEHFLSQ